MRKVNIHEAKTNLSRLVDTAAAGEEIVIAKSGRPVARLMPLQEQAKPRTKGLLKSKIRIGKDFDLPLPQDIIAAFEGKAPR